MARKKSKKAAKKAAAGKSVKAKPATKGKGKPATKGKGKPGVAALPLEFEHLEPVSAGAPKPPKGLGFAGAAAPSPQPPQPPQPPRIEVDFQPRTGDEDVSGKSDSDLGHTVRMKTERGEGAWVFEALDAQLQRRRWLRTVVRA